MKHFYLQETIILLLLYSMVSPLCASERNNELLNHDKIQYVRLIGLTTSLDYTSLHSNPIQYAELIGLITSVSLLENNLSPISDENSLDQNCSNLKNTTHPVIQKQTLINLITPNTKEDNSDNTVIHLLSGNYKSHNDNTTLKELKTITSMVNRGTNNDIFKPKESSDSLSEKSDILHDQESSSEILLENNLLSTSDENSLDLNCNSLESVTPLQIQKTTLITPITPCELHDSKTLDSLSTRKEDTNQQDNSDNTVIHLFSESYKSHNDNTTLKELKTITSMVNRGTNNDTSKPEGSSNCLSEKSDILHDQESSPEILLKNNLLTISGENSLNQSCSNLKNTTHPVIQKQTLINLITPNTKEDNSDNTVIHLLSGNYKSHNDNTTLKELKTITSMVNRGTNNDIFKPKESSDSLSEKSDILHDQESSSEILLENNLLSTSDENSLDLNCNSLESVTPLQIQKTTLINPITPYESPFKTLDSLSTRKEDTNQQDNSDNTVIHLFSESYKSHNDNTTLKELKTITSMVNRGTNNDTSKPEGSSNCLSEKSDILHDQESSPEILLKNNLLTISGENSLNQSCSNLKNTNPSLIQKQILINDRIQYKKSHKVQDVLPEDGNTFLHIKMQNQSNGYKLESTLQENSKYLLVRNKNGQIPIHILMEKYDFANESLQGNNDHSEIEKCMKNNIITPAMLNTRDDKGKSPFDVLLDRFRSEYVHQSKPEYVHQSKRGSTNLFINKIDSFINKIDSFINKIENVFLPKSKPSHTRSIDLPYWIELFTKIRTINHETILLLLRVLQEKSPDKKIHHDDKKHTIRYAGNHLLRFDEKLPTYLKELGMLD